MANNQKASVLLFLLIAYFLSFAAVKAVVDVSYFIDGKNNANEAFKTEYDVRFKSFDHHVVEDGVLDRRKRASQDKEFECDNIDKETKNCTFYDDHKYYKSVFYPTGNKYWMDLETYYKAGDVNTTKILTKSYRRGKHLDLKFIFPFYGHILKNVTVTTGGFLSLADGMHRQLTRSQYIAPLMANFDLSKSNESALYTFDDGQKFIAQWTNVFLHDNVSAGAFTFQCILTQGGQLYFVYKTIPCLFSEISDMSHRKAVGVSDAFYFPRYVWIFKIKILIPEFFIYHTAHLQTENITSDSAYLLLPIPNCVTISSCSECVSAKLTFTCAYCPALKRCSDGIDRHRKDWVNKGCTKSSVSKLDQCPDGKGTVYARDDGKYLHPGMTFLIILLCFVFVVAAVWFGYAYTHPTSPSGLCLIRYRPKNWCRRRESSSDEIVGPDF